MSLRMSGFPKQTFAFPTGNTYVSKLPKLILDLTKPVFCLLNMQGATRYMRAVYLHVSSRRPDLTMRERDPRCHKQTVRPTPGGWGRVAPNALSLSRFNVA